MFIKKRSIKIILISLMVLGLGFYFHGKITKEETQLPTVSVQTTSAQWIDMSEYIITYGTVNFSPEKTHQIAFQNEALVTKIFVVPGQQIKPKDPLFQLIPSNNAKLTIDNAKLAVAFAEKEFDRLTGLRKQFLATNAEIQSANQNLEKAKIELVNLQNQQQNQNGTILRSEVKGTVLAVNASAGQIVAPNSALLNVADGDSRQIRLGVEYEDSTRLKVGMPVTIVPLHNEKKTYESTISAITGQLDATTGLVDVIVNLNNAAGLIPGSMIQGKINVSPKNKVIAVPHSAVLYQQKKPYVFVIFKGKAQFRWVIVGHDNGTMVSILKGVKADEQVVTLGNYQLTDGLNVVEERA